jgi:acyl CoA:acetate/3-ketoacid CoA transferase beta subunit
MIWRSAPARIRDDGSPDQVRRHPSKVDGHQVTGVQCVNRIYTDLAVIDVTPQGLRVVEIVDGLTFDELQRMTGVPLTSADAGAVGRKTATLSER